MDESHDPAHTPQGTTTTSAAATRSCDNDINDSTSDWLASEDISLLNQLLQTPRPHDDDDHVHRPPPLTWDSSSSEKQDDGDDVDSQKATETTTALALALYENDQEREQEQAHALVLTALRRQVQLLQQEYDRLLEQRVAQSVVRAGGKSAPRAATIKLYRNYERLVRVAQALEGENQQLHAQLSARQRHDYHQEVEAMPSLWTVCASPSSTRSEASSGGEKRVKRRAAATTTEELQGRTKRPFTPS